MCTKLFLVLFLLGASVTDLLALDPQRTLSQYMHSVWTTEQGLPQDTVHAITQTKDGYLWVGTDEGLARFDGYEFTTFNEENGALPSDTINALWAASDGSLWIGSAGGLTRYQDNRFTTFGKKDGVVDTYVYSITEDHLGVVWVAAGIHLIRFENGKFTSYSTREVLSIESARVAFTGHDGTLYVAGYPGVVRLEGRQFVSVIKRPEIVSGIYTLTEDRRGNLWIASQGLIKRSPSGKLTRYTMADGLPDNFVRSVLEDHDGNLWAGTNGGLARLEGDKFKSNPPAGSRGSDWVLSIYEDAAGNLWAGMNSGLNRFRDGLFSNYGVPEGLPSEEPTTVYQDHRGQVWVGFHDRGFLQFGNPARAYTTKDGLPSNDVFSIREDHNFDLLIATRAGISRLHDGRLISQIVSYPLNRRQVSDFFESRSGKLFVATPNGLNELQPSGQQKNVIPGGQQFTDYVVVVLETSDGTMWAGTYGKGLWRLRNKELRLFTSADGLSSNQIRSLTEGSDGTVWIGTLGGGLDALRGERFFSIRASDGLLADNVGHIEEDGGQLWLSTTRGICRLQKTDLDDFISGKTHSVHPINYQVSDGLRSAQCAPEAPTSRGGIRSKDGRLWFPTGRGLSVLDPMQQARRVEAPSLHLVEVQADGQPVSLERPANLPPGDGRIQFRFTGIYLSAPEQVRYAYRLEGLDRTWISGVSRRAANYNSLTHGHYRFVVRASIPGGPTSEVSFAFQLRPHYYETGWFRYLSVAVAAVAILAVFRLRLRQVRRRFAIVLQERARLARELHDTLAQGLVGICSQLDVAANALGDGVPVAPYHVELARKMARYSLVEARRSIADLRDTALEGQKLSSALQEAVRKWTLGSTVRIQINISGESPKLPMDTEQNLLRIAQEAVTNSIKHSNAEEVSIRLTVERNRLIMLVIDNGKGFEHPESYSMDGGHFGLLGMRERAEKLGGKLSLTSNRGFGTKVEVTVPL